MYSRAPQPAPGDVIGQQLVAAQERMAIEIWPENWPAFDLFGQLSTQWRVGMSGPTGLAYEAVYPLLDRIAASRAEWDELFADLRFMEAEALKAMRET
jgi:hypothetical protein